MISSKHVVIQQFYCSNTEYLVFLHVYATVVVSFLLPYTYFYPTLCIYGVKHNILTRCRCSVKHLSPVVAAKGLSPSKRSSNQQQQILRAQKYKLYQRLYKIQNTQVTMKTPSSIVYVSFDRKHADVLPYAHDTCITYIMMEKIRACS